MVADIEAPAREVEAERLHQFGGERALVRPADHSSKRGRPTPACRTAQEPMLVLATTKNLELMLLEDNWKEHNLEAPTSCRDKSMFQPSTK